MTDVENTLNNVLGSLENLGKDVKDFFTGNINLIRIFFFFLNIIDDITLFNLKCLLIDFKWQKCVIGVAIHWYLPMWSPLLSSHLYLKVNFSWLVIENFIWIEHILRGHLYLKVTLLLSCHAKFHMNLTSFKKSPVLQGHFFFVSIVTS